MMEDIINAFYENISNKITQTYNQELFSIFDNIPNPIIKFNDVELLKKAQLYVRHTDRLFNKAIARMVCNMFELKNIKARTSLDSFGKCVYVYSISTRFHFTTIEKLAGFPHIPWLNKLVSENRDKQQDKDIYLVLIQSDKIGVEYINALNSQVNNNNVHFYTIGHFFINLFGEKIWHDVYSALMKVQDYSQKLQWFELARLCSPLNVTILKKDVEEDIVRFNYFNEAMKSSLHINSFTLSKTIDRKSVV